MKYVTLEGTAMIGNLPKGPNDGAQLVTNRVAAHLVANGDVLKDNVADADGDDPDDEPAPVLDDKVFDKAVEKAVKSKLRELRDGDEKTLKQKMQDADKALDAELQRIRDEGENNLNAALEAQKAEQDAAFDELVAAAVKEAQGSSS